MRTRHIIYLTLLFLSALKIPLLFPPMLYFVCNICLPLVCNTRFCYAPALLPPWTRPPAYNMSYIACHIAACIWPVPYRPSHGAAYDPLYITRLMGMPTYDCIYLLQHGMLHMTCHIYHVTYRRLHMTCHTPPITRGCLHMTTYHKSLVSPIL